MAGQGDLANNFAAAGLEPAGEVCCVARQPVLNHTGRLQAYELCFREGKPRPSGECSASVSNLFDDAVILGLERFTSGFPAIVACNAEALAGQLVQVLPAAMTILAIPETAETTQSLMEECRALKARGFRFLLDDYTGRPNPLIALCDFVRVDFGSAGTVGREHFRQWLVPEPIGLAAKHVETVEDYRRAAEEGFTLFQGDYLFRPALVKSRRMPANRLFQFEILQNLYRDPVDLKRLTELVMLDTALTYRLLRLVNSPVCAVRQEVRSVESALIMVGLDTFRRFATLAILSDGGPGEQKEILNTALVRARFCELAARMTRQDPAEQYLLGMFSLLPAMLRIPMEEISRTLPLRDDVRQALEGTLNRERCLLSWLERHEHADWAGCDAVVGSNLLSSERLVRFYGDAVVWAHATLRSSTEHEAETC